MLWSRNRSRAARAALSMAVCLGLATPVLAGTVFSWRTEDGTVSFTDDEKHVPSRYRDTMEVRETESITEYERFTPTKKAPDYAERLRQRRDALQGAVSAAAMPVRAGGTVSAIVGGSRYGNGGMVVPVGQSDAGSDEPIIIEKRRTRPSDSMATRHETVVRQGDRIISIQRDELNHRDGTGMVPPLD